MIDRKNPNYNLDRLILQTLILFEFELIFRVMFVQ